MRNTRRLEKEDERYLKQGVEAHGGLCFKFTSPGARGVPDRIVIKPTGEIYFVELKQPVGKLSHLQKWQIQEMRSRNCNVVVLFGIYEIDQFIREVFEEVSN